MIRENKLYDELKVDTASIKRVCTANDLYIFAHASGNLNPRNRCTPTSRESMSSTLGQSAATVASAK